MTGIPAAPGGEQLTALFRDLAEPPCLSDLSDPREGRDARDVQILMKKSEDSLMVIDLGSAGDASASSP
jgi:hypothetical protein